MRDREGRLRLPFESLLGEHTLSDHNLLAQSANDILVRNDLTKPAICAETMLPKGHFGQWVDAIPGDEATGGPLELLRMPIKDRSQ